MTLTARLLNSPAISVFSLDSINYLPKAAMTFAMPLLVLIRLSILLPAWTHLSRSVWKLSGSSVWKQ